MSTIPKLKAKQNKTIFVVDNTGEWLHDFGARKDFLDRPQAALSIQTEKISQALLKWRTSLHQGHLQESKMSRIEWD